MCRGDRESAMEEQKDYGEREVMVRGSGAQYLAGFRRQITRNVIGEFRSEYLLAALGKQTPRKCTAMG